MGGCRSRWNGFFRGVGGGGWGISKSAVNFSAIELPPGGSQAGRLRSFSTQRWEDNGADGVI